MKKFSTFCLVFVALMLLAGLAFADKYKPGTYSGSAVGYTNKSHPGKIEVNVTVDANAITKIDIVSFEQTEKGKQGERSKQAKEEIPAKIIDAQSVSVDSVAKASMSSDGIKLAVAEALEKATVLYKDGTYTGMAKGYDKANHPGKIETKVTIADGKITAIELVAFEQTEKGKQGERSKQAKEEIPAKIIDAQSVSVDSVAKASMSSDGIKLAVANALEQAR